MGNRLFAVGEPVGITVGLVRVRAVRVPRRRLHHRRRCRLGRVRASGFFGVGKSVVVRVVGRVVRFLLKSVPVLQGSRRRLGDPYVQSTLRRR